MALAVVFGPYFFGKYLIPFVTVRLFSYSHIVLILILGAPITLAYWTLNSIYGPRNDEKLAFPGKDQDTYFIFKDPILAQKYGGAQSKVKKIPMQIWHDAYFDGKIELKGSFRD